MKILQERYNIQESSDRHIRCAAHVINLVVQAFLFGLAEAEDPDDVDYYELHKHQDLIYDPAVDEEQQSLEKLSDDELEPAAVIEDDDPPGIGGDSQTWRDDIESDELESLEQKSALERVCLSLFTYGPNIHDTDAFMTTSSVRFA